MNDRTTKRAALTIATLTSFLTPFMVSAINISLPSIQRDFHVNAILLSWIAVSYLLAAAVFLVPSGRVSDIHGRKKIFTFGIWVYTFSSFFCAVSVSAWMLILFRVFQGIGAAMIFATGIAILTSVFPIGERGRVLGITVAAVYIGLSLGPFLGGLLTGHWGWRSIFLLNLPLGLVIIALIRWRLQGEWAEAKGEKFDTPGSIIYSLSLVAIMYGISIIPALRSLVLILLGLLGMLSFILWEAKVPYPVFDVNLFRTNHVFALSNLAALINYSATFAVTFLLSLYLQYIKGFSPEHAGIILISQPLMQAVFSPFAGRLSDRVEPRLIASGGMALTAIGLFLFISIREDSSLSFVVATLVLLGIGFGFFSSPNTNAIMSSVEKRFYGIASGSVGTMRTIGQLLSMGIATLIFAVYIGRVQITPEYYPSFMKSVKAAFLVFTVLCFIGIFASLARGKVLSVSEKSSGQFITKGR